MFQINVLYNHPESVEAFNKHYDEVHAPLAAKIPGVTSYTMSYTVPGPDGSQPAYHAIATLTWDSPEAAQAALASPEFQAAGADLPNFAKAGAQIVAGVSSAIV